VYEALYSKHTKRTPASKAMAVCLSDYNIPCEEWQPGPEDAEKALNIPCEQWRPDTDDADKELGATTPTADDSADGTRTPMTDDGSNWDPAGVDESIPTYAQVQQGGWAIGQAVAMPSSDVGYYVPCAVVPIGPPTPYGNAMMVGPDQSQTGNMLVMANNSGGTGCQQTFITNGNATPPTPVANEGDGSGSESQSEVQQFPEGQSPPQQIPPQQIEGQP
jgi:hypothetical protein